MNGAVTVFGVGAGTAAGLYLNLARSGIDRITVIDRDTVEEKNTSTQAYDLEDVGKPKAKALQRQLERLNPKGDFVGLDADFLEMSEIELQSLTRQTTLFIFSTDEFYAQARGNRLSLKCSKPAIFSSIYYRARCAEVFFSIPGVTPACYRCATASRYEAYGNGYRNLVTSAGSTVFHSQYVNAIVGLIALAIVNNANNSSDQSNWFGELWTHNLLRLQMHPEYGRQPGEPFAMSNAEALSYNFGSNWQAVIPRWLPNYEPCPDCGGLGDLRLASERIHSTCPEPLL